MAICNVTGTIKDIGDNAVQDALVIAFADVPQSMDSDSLIAARKRVTDTTDSNGKFALNLIQGANSRILCADAGLDLRFTVPSQATYNLAEEDMNE